MFPYIYTSENLVIGSYGLLLAIAYLTGRWYFLRTLNNQENTTNAELLIVLLLVFGVFGAKLMFLLKNPEKSDLIFSGTGFSSQGALIGALIATYAYTRFNKEKLSTILDAAAPAAILAYAIARVGCFMSGDDCHGLPTELPWGMSFPNGIEPTSEKVHPVPLYELIYSLIIFAFLVRRQSKELAPYSQFFSLLFAWGLFRFLVEFVSANEKLWFSMSGSQIGASLMFIIATVFFIRVRNKLPIK